MHIVKAKALAPVLAEFFATATNDPEASRP